MEDTAKSTNSKANLLKLMIGTAIGIFFFAVPFSHDGEIVILYSLLSHIIVDAISFFPMLVTLMALISAVGSVYFTYIKTNDDSDFIKDAFVTSTFNVVLRIAAAVIGIMVVFKVGPEMIWDDYTGGLIVNELIPSLYALFFGAFVFIPFLLEYGAMELFGVVFKPIFKPLFKLPGMSAILALGAWVGSGTVGILSVDLEYKKGKFTAKEATILIFGFCTISLPASFIYTTAIGGLEVSYFPAFYLTLFLIGIITSVIISRIPPLSNKSDDYYSGTVDFDESDEGVGQVGFQAALEQAGRAPSFPSMVVNGSKKALFMYLEAFPIIIAIATLALVATEYTPLFDIIAIPITPLLTAIGMPEAAQVAPSLITGFADLLLPFLGATGLTSQLAKFVVCMVGVIQIICMSETGALVLKTDIPVKTWELAAVVLIKTVITVPIALMVGRMIGLT